MVDIAVPTMGSGLDISGLPLDALPVTSGEPTPTRSPTLEDVAAAAGVSRSTASRAINGGSRVSPDAQAAVDAAVQSLRFTPNRAARSLVTHRADAIALLIPEPDDRVTGDDPFFGQVIQGLGQAMRNSDLQMVLLMARHGEDVERTIRYLRRGHVDGAVVVSAHREDDIEKALFLARLPSVFVGRPWYEPASLSYVDTDNRLGGELATRHLLDRGRRRIGTIAGPPDMIAAADRLSGWRDALMAHGLPSDAVAHGNFTTPGGAEAARALIEQNPDLDAIFVASDLMAVGALGVLRAAGLTVPQDVALVGYDNGPIAAATDPPLTTVVNPVLEMSRTAGQVLLARLTADGPVGPPTIFPPILVVRSSS